MLPSMVTAAILANNLPSTEAPVFTAIDWSAIMVPFITEVVPKVADVPTCQKILDAFALPANITLRSELVVRVDAI